MSWSLPANPASRQITGSGLCSAMVRITSTMRAFSMHTSNAVSAMLKTFFPASSSISTFAVKG